MNATDEGFASYIVILNEDAPISYDFTFDMPNGYKLREDGEGGIQALNDDGDVVGVITAPWAVDADGDAVRTAYKLSGSAIVQTIQHGGATYPVVADPSLSIGWGIYIRYGLDVQNPDAYIDWNKSLNSWIFDANCNVSITVAALQTHLASSEYGLTSTQAAIATSAVVGLGMTYCDFLDDLEEDVDDALDEIEEDLPDPEHIPEDCTLMVRHQFGGFIINKLQVEDCGSVTGVYYRQ